MAAVLPSVVLSTAWLAERRRLDATILFDYVVACLVIMALRVLDDLADRPHDCPREPARIACQPDATGALASLATLASLAASLLLIATRSWPAIILAGAAYAMVAGG